MNKFYTTKIFLISFSLLSLIALMSNSSGRGKIFGQAVTGAPGDSNTTCASSGCHSSGAFTPTGKLVVLDQDGNTIDNYIPGETYEVTLSVETSGNPNAFGFQMVAISEDNLPATDWSNLGTNIQEIQIGGKNYIEHNTPSSSNEFKTSWTAPSVGAGEITFYYAVNAVNKNGSPSGDGGSNSSFTLSELLSSTDNDLEKIVKTYPNPVQDFVIIDGLNEDFNYTLFDIHGNIIESAKTNGKSIINTSELNSGLYLISIRDKGKITTRKFVKN